MLLQNFHIEFSVLDIRSLNFSISWNKILVVLNTFQNQTELCDAKEKQRWRNRMKMHSKRYVPSSDQAG